MVKKIVLLVCTCLLLLCTTLTAQQITGKIANINGQVITGATIKLKLDADTSRKQTTISDVNGNFKFENLALGNYGITASYIGFKTYTTKVTLTVQNANITLAEITLQNNSNKALKEVSVTAQKNYIEHKIDRTIVNVGALISNNGASAADALNQAPGVEVNDNGIALRGREGVVVYIDDKPTHLAGRDLIYYLKALPAATLDKIEIMTIPPAQYGAAGTAGIINIKTKKSIVKGFNGSLNAAYNQGQRPKANSNFNFNYKTGKLNWFGNLSYSLNKNNYNVDWDRRYLTQSTTLPLSPVLHQHNFEDITVNSFNYMSGFDYDASKHTTIGLVYTGSASPHVEHSDYQLHFNEANGMADSSILVKSELSQHTDHNAINFNLRHQFKKTGNELIINLDYLNHSTNSNQSSVNNSYLANGSFKSNYTLLSDNAFFADVYGAKADIITELPAAIKLTTGLQTTYSVRRTNGQYSNLVNNAAVVNDSLTNHFDNSENINSAYISLQKSFKRFALQAGLRAENTNATATAYGFGHANGNTLQFNYTDVFPTLYVLYKLDSAAKNTLTFAAGRRISRPNYSDLNPSVFFFDKYTSFSGNPLLQPAYSNNFELTYSQSKGFTAGLLYNTTHNQISSVYSLINEAIIQNNFNIDKVVNYGIFANPSVNATNWLSLNIYAQVTRMHYTGTVSNGIVLDNDMTAFNGTASSQIKMGNGWSAEVSGLYRGKRSLGQGYYNPLWQLNSAIQKKLWKDKASISLIGRDIFHSFIINRQVTVQQVQLSRDIHNDTQQVGLSFSYKFGTSGKSRVNHNGLEGEAGRVN